MPRSRAAMERRWIPACAGMTHLPFDRAFARPGSDAALARGHGKTLDPRLRGDDAFAFRPRFCTAGLMRHFTELTM